MRDRVTLYAIIGALVAITFSMIITGASPMILLKPGALILVFGGTFCAGIAGFMKSDLKNLRGAFTQAIGAKPVEPQNDIVRLVGLAEIARREGLLALEKSTKDVDDPFFKRGIEMTVDGNDPEEIRDILESEIESLAARHKAGVKFFSDLGGFAPTLGILGTVIGLVHVLANLSNVHVLGPAIAEAFTATLWGVLSANIFWLPLCNKLKRASELEIHGRRMILDGLLAIQAGNSPRMVQAKLQTYVAPKHRFSHHGEKAA